MLLHVLCACGSPDLPRAALASAHLPFQEIPQGSGAGRAEPGSPKHRSSLLPSKQGHRDCVQEIDKYLVAGAQGFCQVPAMDLRG